MSDISIGAVAFGFVLLIALMSLGLHVAFVMFALSLVGAVTRPEADALVRANEMEKARELQYAINNIIYALCGCKGNMYGVIKEVLRRRENLDIGGVRAPLANLVPEDMPKVEACCEMIAAAIRKYC